MGDLLLAIWFFVPVGFANIAPIIAQKISLLRPFNAPIDMGWSWRGRRILGANKTWRGLIAGIIVATLTFWAQQTLVAHSNNSWIAAFPGGTPYAELPTVLFGFLFAIGTLGGDAVKSFFKRQRNVAPGRPWPLLDQIGEILGAIAVTMPLVNFSFGVYVGVAVIWVVVDFSASALAYRVGWKERPI